MSGILTGKVYLVGAGPGDPELLTRKAYRLLRNAEIVVHDDLVSPEVLRLVPPEASLINVGKRCGHKHISQEQINDLMLGHARAGKTVIRLKGGDPLVFGRAGEEMKALQSAGVEFEIVPGITAGLGAASSFGLSLTDRRFASKVVFATGHHCAGKERPRWEGLAGQDATLVLYMPGIDFEGLARELIAAGMERTTPCLAVSRATQRDEQSQRTTIENLSSARHLPAPVVLIIGAVVDQASEIKLESYAMEKG